MPSLEELTAASAVATASPALSTPEIKPPSNQRSDTATTTAIPCDPSNMYRDVNPVQVIPTPTHPVPTRPTPTDQSAHTIRPAQPVPVGPTTTSPVEVTRTTSANTAATTNVPNNDRAEARIELSPTRIPDKPLQQGMHTVALVAQLTLLRTSTILVGRDPEGHCVATCSGSRAVSC